MLRNNSRVRAFALAWLLVGAAGTTALAQSASLLPNGEQTFVDQNGQPYGAGKVYFYTPNTLTPKTTWSDPNQTTPNSNPVVLDNAGRAVIYGSGQYRQIVKDVFGNTVWDQLTAGLGGGGGGTGLVVNSISALRAVNVAQSPNVYVTQYSSTSGKGGGEFNATGQSTCADNGGTLIQAVGGCYARDTGGQAYQFTWFGAVCGGVQVSDGISASGSAFVSSASAKWAGVKVGWVGVVDGAASGGQQLVTTVATVATPSSVSLAAPAGASGTGETISLYPDDTAALDATWTAAGTAGVAASLPNGDTCGYANPGSGVIKTISANGLNLNNGNLWLGQTGPTVDWGVGLAFPGNNKLVVGPGTIDGLYQTNQSIAQFNTHAVSFTGGNNDGITGSVVIQNTKGQAFNTGVVSNFRLTDLLVQNCGDFSYQHSSTPGDMFGRSMCGAIFSATQNLTISGYTALNAAQSGLLIETVTDSSFHAAITNCYFSGNGYYGLDVEDTSGAFDIANCENYGNSLAPSGALIYGGYVFRDVPYISAVNIRSYLTDTNALVMQSTDSGANLDSWNLANIEIGGTSATHGGQISLAFNSPGAFPQRVSLKNVNYDRLFLSVAGSACDATRPKQQLLSFDNINSSQLFSGMQTLFLPNAGTGEWTYVQGSDSNLGNSGYDSVGATNNTVGLDLFRVQTNGAIAVGGAGATPDYIAPTLTNPITSFTCP